jgi:hypothetical protein
MTFDGLYAMTVDSSVMQISIPSYQRTRLVAAAYQRHTRLKWRNIGTPIPPDKAKPGLVCFVVDVGFNGRKVWWTHT